MKSASSPAQESEQGLQPPAAAGHGPAGLEIDVQVDDAFAALVNAAELAAVATATLRQQARSAGVLTLVVTDDAGSAGLNRAYRGEILPPTCSFAAQEEEDDAPALQLPPEVAAELAAYLGDVVIAYPYAAQQAGRFGNTVDAELRLLTVHGVLHLLGYDHATPDEEAAMWTVQEQMLAAYWRRRAGTARLRRIEGAHEPTTGAGPTDRP